MKKCDFNSIRIRKAGDFLMAQKLYCPVCGKILIKNYDLVVDSPVIMDLERIKATDKEVHEITCHSCKRRLRYFVED